MGRYWSDASSIGPVAARCWYVYREFQAWWACVVISCCWSTPAQFNMTIIPQYVFSYYIFPGINSVITTSATLSSFNSINIVFITVEIFQILPVCWSSRFVTGETQIKSNQFIVMNSRTFTREKYTSPLHSWQMGLNQLRLFAHSEITTYNDLSGGYTCIVMWTPSAK